MVVFLVGNPLISILDQRQRISTDRGVRLSPLLLASGEWRGDTCGAKPGPAKISAAEAERRDLAVVCQYLRSTISSVITAEAGRSIAFGFSRPDPPMWRAHIFQVQS